ncbi:MAG: arginase family protein [Desulfobacterales bacterium]|jgi:arginase
MKNRLILTPFFLDEFLPGLESLAPSDWHINKPDLPDGDIQHRLSAIHQTLAHFAAETIENNELPVSIAGDCCTAIGMLAGLHRAGVKPILIWFDAHGDFNTWDTTPSGFLGGMPLAMLVGRGEQTMLEALELSPLAESMVVLSDARDLDPEEQKLVETSNINHLPDVNALFDYPFPPCPVYVHLDTDIVNPNEAPAMNYPAKGGPSSSDLTRIFAYLYQSGNLAAVSVSTWNPELDKNGQSRKVCMQLINALLGNR